MPCRPTDVRNGFVFFQHFNCRPGSLSAVGQQSVHHGLMCFNLQFLADVLECVPGEVHLGYGVISDGHRLPHF